MSPDDPEAERPLSSILKWGISSDECASPVALPDSSSDPAHSNPRSVSIAPDSSYMQPGPQKDISDLDINERSPRKPLIRPSSSRRLLGRLPSSTNVSRFATPTDRTLSGDDRDTSHENLVCHVREWIARQRDKSSNAFTSLSNQSGVHHGQQHYGDSELDKLEEILKRSLHLDHILPRRTSALRLKPSRRRRTRKYSHYSSDTENAEYEAHVPSCDVILDNSRTLNYAGGASDDSDGSPTEPLVRTASFRDHDAWAVFKVEIVRLAHTLRLKGWRRVPLDMSYAISVERLSGALTNAVYVVSPPDELPSSQEQGADEGAVMRPQKSPPKLLLRIYGAQAEHLIDRESELAILRRLARKRIGPRLLGTFANGRFEEFFNAKALTAEELRNPDTSRQIAMRMRELHDGIELLERERDDGPFIWREWDRWVDRVEQVVTWLDGQVEAVPPGTKLAVPDLWKRRGHICGLPWKRFRETFEKYREWIYAQYGGPQAIREQLVFAHNDAQYGNILRVMPTGDSPLLLPANTHKRLIVIDFEYANANLPGYEFANHFSEWCYNYHDPKKPYACNANRYPTPEEQERFLRAYVVHQSKFHDPSPSSSSTNEPPGPGHLSRQPTSSISNFMLDVRGPPFAPPSTTSPQVEDSVSVDAEVSRLLRETRMWRLASAAKWVAWGVVQAKVPGMPDFEPQSSTRETEEVDEDDKEYRELAAAQGGKGDEEEEQEEFDYLGYTQHRAMMFWGDAIQMGFIKEEELPEDLVKKLKLIPY
ncbi:kinase-like protein [Piedraia hortae CBS 480.64]|uniref:Kinase-like protein n=1 Tax=Piedraia hortae CBS 480.64 TaxID=1314780 RepID=A0A6A7BYA3_9PEZI|nr:kinase-like protein [Piedraia hortae CBS 480.64]